MIKEFLRSSFPLSSIRADLIGYLDEQNSKDVQANSYWVDVYNEDTMLFEKIEIDPQDDITIISYGVSFQFEIDLYYKIEIGIGEYEKGEPSSSFFTVGKCLAILRYNDDFSLYDVEFNTNKINQK